MMVVPQTPLDYQPGNDAVAPGRRRFKRAALIGAVGIMMAPVAVFVAYVASLAEQWAVIRLLLPYATLLSGDGTLRGDDGSFVVGVAQFPAYGLIVGAAQSTSEKAGPRALIAVGSAHILALLASFAASYAAGAGG